MSLPKFIALGLALVAPAVLTQAPAAYWTPAPDGPQQNTPPAGNVSNVEFLGNVTSVNTYSSRDGGFHGTVGKFQLNSYGDTSQCREGSQKDNCVSIVVSCSFQSFMALHITVQRANAISFSSCHF